MYKSGQAAEALRDGQAHEVAGDVAAAAECYAAAAERAAQDDEPRVLSEALRRRGVLCHLQAAQDRARSLCCRAYDVALVAGVYDLAAEALNALGGFELERGRLAEARQQYHAALEFSMGAPALIGKIEQNLGVVANIRGDWSAARQHYQRALAAYEQTRDLRGCAIAYHNLGRVHAEQKEWEEAGRRYHLSCQLARAAGDLHLQGMAFLSRAEVHLALRQCDDARDSVNEALGIFTRLEATRDRAGAHRLLGAIHREMAQLEAAELHLAMALEIAQRADCPLEEADTSREMARLYRVQGQNETSLTWFRRARDLFSRIDAPTSVAEVDAEIAKLPLPKPAATAVTAA